jgi:hypothetical protein
VLPHDEALRARARGAVRATLSLIFFVFFTLNGSIGLGMEELDDDDDDDDW